MKSYTYSRTGEKLYNEVLDNGFQVYVLPSDKKNTFYACIGVKYGSNDVCFVPLNENKFKKTNYGVAHFLEHLIFSMEDGTDPFAYFNKSGVNVNASTSFYATKYYMWGTNDFNKNLDYLLSVVTSPYFTNENVISERGIINEEIRMYEDDTGWFIDDLARKMIFKELPIKEKIAGTFDSVSKITKEELYNCYNTFYVPNNMFLVVSGNVDVDNVLKIVKSHKKLNSLKPNHNIKRKKYDESREVSKEFCQCKNNVYLPKMKYVFKIRHADFSIKEKIKLNMYLNMFMTLIFGSTSEFHECILSENYATGFYSECAYYDDFSTLEFVAETERADLFKELVDKYLSNIEITENAFERIKKVWIASEIRISDNEDFLADSVLDDIVTYNKMYTDRIDIIETLKVKELKQIIKELNFENNCFILINPKEDN